MPSKRLLLARLASVAAIVAAATTGGCRDEGFSPGPVASSMEVIRQERPADTTHGAAAIVILRIFDASAQPAAGVNVRFDAPITQMNGLGYGTLYIGTDTTQPSNNASNLNYADTDNNGFVAVSVSRGAVPGNWAVTVTSADVRALRDSLVFATTSAPAASGGAKR